MHKIIKYRLLILLGICLFFSACNNPETTLDYARSTRKRVDFEHVIARYPDTPYAVEASVYLLELDMWEKTRGTREVSTYQTFLTKYPKGLFAVDANVNIGDIQAWNTAKDKDILFAYEQYLDRTKAPLLFRERAEARKNELVESAALYNGVEENADLEALLKAKRRLDGTGYSALLSSQLEHFPAFLIKLVNVGIVDSKSGPTIEFTPQKEELSFSLDINTVFAINKNGQKVEMTWLIPIEPFDKYDLKIKPYSKGTYEQTTWIPASNSFTDKHVNVFGTNKATTYFEILLNKNTPIRLGLLFEEHYENLDTFHILGTEINK